MSKKKKKKLGIKENKKDSFGLFDGGFKTQQFADKKDKIKKQLNIEKQKGNKNDEG